MKTILNNLLPSIWFRHQEPRQLSEKSCQISIHSEDETTDSDSESCELKESTGQINLNNVIQKCNHSDPIIFRNAGDVEYWKNHEISDVYAMDNNLVLEIKNMGHADRKKKYVLKFPLNQKTLVRQLKKRKEENKQIVLKLNDKIQTILTKIDHLNNDYNEPPKIAKHKSIQYSLKNLLSSEDWKSYSIDSKKVDKNITKKILLNENCFELFNKEKIRHTVSRVEIQYHNEYDEHKRRYSDIHKDIIKENHENKENIKNQIEGEQRLKIEKTKRKDWDFEAYNKKDWDIHDVKNPLVIDRKNSGIIKDNKNKKLGVRERKSWDLKDPNPFIRIIDPKRFVLIQHKDWKEKNIQCRDRKNWSYNRNKRIGLMDTKIFEIKDSQTSKPDVGLNPERDMGFNPDSKENKNKIHERKEWNLKAKNIQIRKEWKSKDTNRRVRKIRFQDAKVRESKHTKLKNGALRKVNSVGGKINECGKNSVGYKNDEIKPDKYLMNDVGNGTEIDTNIFPNETTENKTSDNTSAKYEMKDQENSEEKLINNEINDAQEVKDVISQENYDKISDATAVKKTDAHHVSYLRKPSKYKSAKSNYSHLFVFKNYKTKSFQGSKEKLSGIFNNQDKNIQTKSLNQKPAQEEKGWTLPRNISSRSKVYNIELLDLMKHKVRRKRVE